jgi:uncharacterized metal-binding protein
VVFEGGEAVADVGSGAVDGCAGEVVHRGDGRAECQADLALEGVELGIAKEADLEGEELPNEKSSDDSYSVGLGERGGG